jgi:alkylated DNA repair dioxygenase AlkB
MVAVVSLGATRMFAMRPRGGGTSLRVDDAAEGRGGGGARKSALRLPQSHGDLLVMGGSCQRTWEHAVPKTSTPVGPRMSIQFRPRDVR